MGKGRINYDPYVDWLQGKGANLYTQFGEDGLIQGCLDRIGSTNRHCFEIGAADGRFFSNTLRLREEDWYAVLIESDPKLSQALEMDFGHQSTCIYELCEDLDRTLSTTDIDLHPDLGVIDIDGQDWYLWNDLEKYVPRVMLVEIATSGEDEPVPDRGEKGQAGLTAIRNLGEEKGYELVATTYCNALFVHKEALR